MLKVRQTAPAVTALLAAARATPGSLTYASSGDGSPQHLGGPMIETCTQTRLLHVPQRGGALAINDTTGGQVDAVFAVMPEAVQPVQSGLLHALGVMSSRRSATMQQLPALAEAGIEEIRLHAKLTRAAGLVPRTHGVAWPGPGPPAAGADPFV